MPKCELNCPNEASDMTYSFYYEGLDIEIPICLAHWKEYEQHEDNFIDKHLDEFIDYYTKEYDEPLLGKDEVSDEKVDQAMHEGR